MKVLSVQVGRPRDVEWRGEVVNTGIFKEPVHGPVIVRWLDLDGDEQADLTVHGGLRKAVYGYPGEHYAFWQTVRAQAGVALWDEPIPPGSLGENLTLAGVVESEVFIGDVLRFPGCALAVSEPRYPCFKFNAAMGFKHAGKLMVQSGWCGWYLAVREPGTIAAGETFAIEPGPRQVGIAEIFRARTGRG